MMTVKRRPPTALLWDTPKSNVYLLLASYAEVFFPLPCTPPPPPAQNASTKNKTSASTDTERPGGSKTFASIFSLQTRSELTMPWGRLGDGT